MIELEEDEEPLNISHIMELDAQDFFLQYEALRELMWQFE